METTTQQRILYIKHYTYENPFLTAPNVEKRQNVGHKMAPWTFELIKGFLCEGNEVVFYMIIYNKGFLDQVK